MNRLRAAALLGGFSLLPLAARAYDITPNVTFSGIYSDNVGRTATNRQDDWALIAGAGLMIQTVTPTIDADITAGDQYMYFVNHTFASQQLPNVLADVSWHAVPKFFDWNFEDQYGQVATDAFESLSPSDRENTNYLTTGPKLTLPMGKKLLLELEARFSDVYYSVSNIDNMRYEEDGALQYSISPLHILSLNYEHEATDFKRSDLYQDYSEQNVFARFDDNVRVMTMRLDLGATALSSGGVEKWRPLADLALYRLIGVYTTVGLEYAHRISDAADNFRAVSQNPVFNGTDVNVQQLADPFVTETYSAFVYIERPRGYLRAYGFVTHENYEVTTTNDRTVEGADVEGTLSITSRDRLKGQFRYERDRIPSNNDTGDYTGLQLEWSHAIGPALNLALGAERYSRRSHFEGDFDEDRVTLSIRYEPAPRTFTPRFAPYRSRGIRLPSGSGQPSPDAIAPQTPQG